ncbi:DUF2752 domain-containing protein [Janibacter sp. DB-40]|uniref:DUF2752 domain-containing protein n=1 Tax=Janibacter sp. DB-40 TaxID=3028808 RepID=UPI002404AAAC|nr:DUF2752 domain-containing protein [Janibacter sp. DB-40]
MTAATGQGPLPLAQGTNRSERIVVLVIAAVSLVGLGVARLWPVASVDSGEPTCLLRIFTGLPCPGCGMTRSWVHLAHGDVLTAFEYNLFGPIGMAAAAGIVAYVGVALVRRRPPERLLSLVDPKVLLGLITVWLAYSAVRMVSLGVGQDYFALVVA